MNRRTLFPRRALCALLALALLSGWLAPAAPAQKRKPRPVVVSFGQPNIWSLEQAHYLLARMHQQNLDLRARELAEDALDPNAVNGTRINVLKQLIEAGVSFDQGVGFQNSLATRNAQFNSQRRVGLTSDRDQQQADLLRLAREHARLARERALLEADKSASKEDKDKKDAEITENEAERDAVKTKLDFDNAELKDLGAGPGEVKSPDLPGQAFDKSKLPETILDRVGADKLFDLAKDPKLNASTILDNHVQMQYEIIAKQLTLLRDEVGPGERLVFLELPQSIYTTPGDGDQKMAQAWWHVNGYTRTDPLVRQLLELYELEQKWDKIQQVDAYRTKAEKFANLSCDDQADQARKDRDALRKNDPVAAVFFQLKCDRAAARVSVLGKLYHEADSVFSRVQQNGARDTSEVVDAIRKVIAVRPDRDADLDKNGAPRRSVVDARGPQPADAELTQSPSFQTESARRARILELKQKLLKVLSEDEPLHPQANTQKELADKYALLDEIKNTFMIDDGSEFEKGIEFIRLDDNSAGRAFPANVERRTVRTVEIIPRQSSMNVNDLNDTVKAVGLLGAFKFLFGLGAQTSFQRQREQFEQFIHQELYASGFGKGDRDFGWTFGALPGTKRVAPGVRTTYAALVVPDDAESIVLTARGCYFPRKENQPLDFAETADSRWDGASRNCGDEQTYILPVPGGGDAESFWVTNVDYQNASKGARATVSVRGNNFSSQIGVLVDGVPLTPSVGLAQPLMRVAHKGLDETCPPTRVCGEFERIDPHQVVFSFSMPKDADGKDFEGTPTVTLVAPGKSIDLNRLTNITVNRAPNVKLGDKSLDPMFGESPEDPSARLSITDFKVFRVDPDPRSRAAVALLRGTKFCPDKDAIFINGVEMGAQAGTKVTARGVGLYRVEFQLPPDERLIVTVAQEQDDGQAAVAEKSFDNPLALKIGEVSVISYDPPTRRTFGVMLVRIKGVGFDTEPRLYVEGARSAKLLDFSSGEAVVRLVEPEASAVITLTNPATGQSARAVVARTLKAGKERDERDEK